MKNEIKHTTACITGAGSGLGRQIAIHLSKLGVNLILVGRTLSKLEETKELCENVKINCFSVDISKEESVKEFYASICELDTLINNAGILSTNRFENTTTEEFDSMYENNVRGPFLMSKYALPLLRQSNCPTIINIGSVVSRIGYEEQVAYTMSKHALMGMTKVMAKELSKEDIRVHILCPGGIQTGMVTQANPELANKPVMLPEDIADIIEFILCHRGNAIIDQINVHRIGKEPFQ